MAEVLSDTLPAPPGGFLDIFDRAQSPADGKGNEYAVGHGTDHPGDDIAAIGGGRDIQKHQFIGPFGIVALGRPTDPPRRPGSRNGCL